MRRTEYLTLRIETAPAQEFRELQITTEEGIVLKSQSQKLQFLLNLFKRTSK